MGYGSCGGQRSWRLRGFTQGKEPQYIPARAHENRAPFRAQTRAVSLKEEYRGPILKLTSFPHNYLNKDTTQIAFPPLLVYTLKISGPPMKKK